MKKYFINNTKTQEMKTRQTEQHEIIFANTERLRGPLNYTWSVSFKQEVITALGYKVIQ